METKWITKSKVKDIRIQRISEALAFPKGTLENPKKITIYKFNGKEAYFLKPGKEANPNRKKINENDMTPCIEGFEDYQFQDIWADLMSLSAYLSPDSFKKLCAIIYRMGFLLDHKTIDGITIYAPNKTIQDEINSIKQEVLNAGVVYDIESLLYFIDILAWNEDVKYQATKINSKLTDTGRINTIFSIISVPLMANDFVQDILANQRDLSQVNFSILASMAQSLSRSRGIIKISKSDFISYLSPYITE